MSERSRRLWLVKDRAVRNSIATPSRNDMIPRTFDSCFARARASPASFLICPTPLYSHSIVHIAKALFLCRLPYHSRNTAPITSPVHNAGIFPTNRPSRRLIACRGIDCARLCSCPLRRGKIHCATLRDTFVSVAW